MYLIFCKISFDELPGFTFLFSQFIIVSGVTSICTGVARLVSHKAEQALLLQHCKQCYSGDLPVTMRKTGFFLIFLIMMGMLWALAGTTSKKVEKEPLKEAMYYQPLKGGRVNCLLCFRRCIIAQGGRGVCRNRENRDGKLYSLVYAKPSAVHIDPIEKEPQLHMLSGTEILCLGTAGCNFRCRHCQNWHLSQRAIEEIGYLYYLPPEEVVKLALKKKIPTISFTYNEPVAFYEYVYDVARLAKPKNLKILWHSNGSLNPEPLRELLKYTDAVTIDLKGFTEKFYQEVSSAKLEPVLETLKIIKEKGVWLELVNLVIPTFNDNPEEIRRMCEWIKENLGEETPLHFSRFSPAYRLTKLPPTPIETLEKAYKIAKDAGLLYVTIGNLPGHKYNSTFCPKCGKLLIHRIHFQVLRNDVIGGRCRFCQHKIPGIWK